MSGRVMERVKRPTGIKWRRRMYEMLCERDGAICAECKCPDRTIWRRGGVNGGEQWGEFPWENARHTIVYPTSVLEVDHKKPLSEGGTNDDCNLWLLCTDCHKAKTSSERSSRLKRLFAEARA